MGASAAISSGGEPRATFVRRRSVAGRRRPEAVDNRQIERLVLRSVLIDDGAAIVNEIELAADPADGHRCTLGQRDLDRGRQRPAQRRILDPGRRKQTLTPRFQVGPYQVLAAKAVEEREHIAVRQPGVSADDHTIDRERTRMDNSHATAIEAVHDHHRRQRVLRRRQREGSEPPPPHRLDVRTTKMPVGRRGNRAHDSSSIKRSGRPPIDPAPSVITTSPARATRAIA